MRPLLPLAEHVMPYLKQIDQNRWYTNFGPLVENFEKRLADFYGVSPPHIKSMANGTEALINILKAMELPKGSFCLMPSWTFIATPASALSAGLVPYFLDVSEDTWQLEPEAVKAQLPLIKGKVSSLMVVAPFGVPVDRGKWDCFTEETGIKVVIDGAAAFDSISNISEAGVGKTPIMISMHATKVFGIGEGGIVLSTDEVLIQRLRELSNFGFNISRVIRIPGTNSKMCEYNAAVGMAALDLWSTKREVWLRLKHHYIEAFRRTHIHSPWLEEEWVSSTCNVQLPKENALEVVAKLAEYGIEARQWWGNGCHAQPAYAHYSKNALPVTEKLGRSVIALPFTLDMRKEDVAFVAETLKSIVE